MLVIGIDRGRVFAAARAKELGMIYERIAVNSEIMFGKPIIKGTGITVEQILRKLAGGMSVKEIMADHPHLMPDDIYAAVAGSVCGCGGRQVPGASFALDQSE